MPFKIILLLVAVVCIVLTSHFLKKGANWIAIIAALVAELFVFLSFSSSQSFIDQFSCVIGGLVFVILSFKFLQGGKHAESFLLALIAAGSFFCSLSGVQSLLKTNLLEHVTGKLVEYGNKIDSFQVSMNNIQLELRQQQEDIRKQQSNVVVAQTAIRSQQSKTDGQYERMEKAEGRIEKQQEQMKDIQTQFNEAWVAQSINADDTNNCIDILEQDNSQTVFLLLSNVPVAASVSCIVRGPHQQQMSVTPLKYSTNIFLYLFAQGTDLRNANFAMGYFRNFTETNGWKKMLRQGDSISMDGVPWGPRR